MSQIGYMMLAAGLGPIGGAFAIMHLVTHGFFKAGLFLGAGSVMHGMKDQTDMRRFGHLGVFMKATWITFMMGWLAILGVPPFSGFWSKDAIIEAAFEGTGWQPWVFGLVTLFGAGITAFYMSRIFFMTFQGKARWTDDQHPHESPALMTVPMIILAVGSVCLGGILKWVGFDTWLKPVTESAGELPEHHAVIPVPLIMALTLILVVLGALLAWWKFASPKAVVPEIAPAADGLVRAARQDLYQDTVNNGLFVKPGQALVKGTTVLDKDVVDGAVRGVGWLVTATGGVVRRLQTGYVRSYAATMLAGVIILAAIALAVVL
jgi:NADH-quinone oxidoreductase subunit L